MSTTSAMSVASEPMSTMGAPHGGSQMSTSSGATNSTIETPVSASGAAPVTTPTSVEVTGNVMSTPTKKKPLKVACAFNPNESPATGVAQPASDWIQKMVANLLERKQPKQHIEVVGKTLLFLRSRDSTIHPNEFEQTPSVKIMYISMFDELRTRSTACRFARELVEFMGRERRKGYIVDELFKSTTMYDVIYVANNYINAYYNCHTVDSVEPMELAIQCVQTACKSQSAFRRLDRVVLSARSCFNRQLTMDQDHYFLLEMKVLQSIGFQIDLAGDYPQTYIHKFRIKMTEMFECFRANSKKMSTICHCAGLLATRVIECSPIMLNRESSSVAAACLLISNEFKPICNIKDWFVHVDGCEKYCVRQLQETADLVFDTLKYHSSDWNPLPFQASDTVLANQAAMSLNVPNRSTAAATSLACSPQSVSSPPPHMLSPISSVTSERSLESSGFGSEYANMSLNGSIGNSPHSITHQTYQSYMRHKQFSFKNSRSCSASTYSTDSAGSVKSRKTVAGVSLVGKRKHGELSVTPPSAGDGSMPAPLLLKTLPVRSKSHTGKHNNHNPDDSHDVFSKPEQIPHRKSSSSIASPLAKKSINLQLLASQNTYPPNKQTPKLLPCATLPIPQPATLPRRSSTATCTAVGFSFDSPSVADSIESQPSPAPSSTDSFLNSTLVPLENSFDSETSSSVSSSQTGTPKVQQPLCQQSMLGNSPHPQARPHPQEKKFRDRLHAIVGSEEVVRYYAKSKERYATLTRREKDIVKDYKNRVKAHKERRHREALRSGTPLPEKAKSKKRRRHSDFVTGTNAPGSASSEAEDDQTAKAPQAKRHCMSVAE